MATWVWVLIAIAVVVVIAALVWLALSRQRSTALRRRFGPEYERTLRAHETRREAEAELEQRVERRQQFEIQPLPAAARQRYLEAWREVQAQFVDAPDASVARGHSLLRSVMGERGYPVEDFEQRVADLSVDHPVVVEHYRAANTIAERSARGEATTEELRQALQHYRALFDDLLEAPADEPLSREAAAEHTNKQERTGR